MTVGSRATFPTVTGHRAAPRTSASPAAATSASATLRRRRLRRARQQRRHRRARRGSRRWSPRSRRRSDARRRVPEDPVRRPLPRRSRSPPRPHRRGGATGVRSCALVSGTRVDGADVWARTQLVRGVLGSRARSGDRDSGPPARPLVRVPVEGGTVRRAAPAARGHTGPRRPSAGGGASARSTSAPPTSGTRSGSTGLRSTSSTTSGPMLAADGYGADRGYLEPDDGRFDEPARRVRVVRRRGAAPRASTSTTSASSTSDCSCTTRTSSSRGAGERVAGATGTCPTSVVRHVHAATSGRGIGAQGLHYDERNRLLVAHPPRVHRRGRMRGVVLRYLLVTGVVPAARRARAVCSAASVPRGTIVGRATRAFAAFLVQRARHAPHPARRPHSAGGAGRGPISSRSCRATAGTRSCPGTTRCGSASGPCACRSPYSRWRRCSSTTCRRAPPARAAPHGLRHRVADHHPLTRVDQVGARARRAAELEERLEHLDHRNVLGRARCDRGPARGARARRRRAARKSASSSASTSSGGTVSPSPWRSMRSAKRVAAGRDDRQRRPEVVEDARPERERGLDVVEVRADADVGLEQVVLAVVVVDPVLVEEHVGVDEAELVGELPRARPPCASRARAGSGASSRGRTAAPRAAGSRSLSTARSSVSGSNQL